MGSIRGTFLYSKQLEQTLDVTKPRMCVFRKLRLYIHIQRGGAGDRNEYILHNIELLNVTDFVTDTGLFKIQPKFA
jgi:hypothetical protein